MQSGTHFDFARFCEILRPFREILRPFRATPLGSALPEMISLQHFSCQYELIIIIKQQLITLKDSVYYTDL